MEQVLAQLLMPFLVGLSDADSNTVRKSFHKQLKLFICNRVIHVVVYNLLLNLSSYSELCWNNMVTFAITPAPPIPKTASHQALAILV